MKMALCGNVSVGKTSMMTKIMSGTFRYYQEPTIDTGFYEIDLGKKRAVEMWDICGRKRHWYPYGMYIRNAAVVLIICDAKDSQSYKDATTHWYDIVVEHVPPARILLVTNKADAASCDRCVSFEEATLFAKQKGMLGHIEMSVKTSDSAYLRSILAWLYDTLESTTSNRRSISECVYISDSQEQCHICQRC